MHIPFFTISRLSETDAFLACLAARANTADSENSVEETVASILADVKKRGLAALMDYTRRFDAPDFAENSFVVPEAALERAAGALPAGDKAILLEAAGNIRRFHEAQKARSWFIPGAGGAILGQRVTPVGRAGLYVPGGKGGATPLLSSLLMNAIPAQVAEVPELVVVSPPRPDGTISEYILAAAHLLGIREVYAAGSAWAVAALAFGAGPLRPVDVIVGPGNIFVTTAKRMLIGRVGIDMIAGPSEVCVIADATANPAWAAADLLSQAEHDPQASAVCLCTDPATAAAIAEEVERQCALLPRRDIAEISLARYSAIISVPDPETALEIANRIAPEHLELLVDDPWALLPGVRHAGAIFMGHYAPEPMGDYYAGPNHVLPTMGTARFSSALSVDTFCKKSSIIAAGPAFARAGAQAVARLARLEGLEGHAKSALCRLE